MQTTIARLEHEGVKVDEELKAEIAALWHWGIERIANPALKTSLIEYYRTAVPWQFFVEPSSASGSHHPPHHNRKGGIVRHLTECCIFAPRLLELYGYTVLVEEPKEKREKKNKKDEVRRRLQKVDPQALDVVIAATLITDTFKNGCPWGEKTNPEHGDISAFEWTKVASRLLVDSSVINKVYIACYWHYGRWTPNQNAAGILALPNPFTQIVHLLDAILTSDEIKLLYTAVPKIPVPSNEKPPT
jgi:hypothetical protein